MPNDPGKARKARPRAEWAETTRQAQRDYQKRARAKLAADVPADVADAFREYCIANGQTVSGMLSRFVYETLAQANRPADPD